jgi:protein-tyrosine phosphatase
VTKSILFVCTGNICRSPMGEYLFRHMAQNVQGNSKIVVASAGVGALVGHGADEKAVEVMAENGIDITAHRARQLNETLVKEHELILVMEHWQQKEIEQRYPFARGRVHLLGKWAEGEIADPYKQPKANFVEAFNEINLACQQWCEKIC